MKLSSRKLQREPRLELAMTSMIDVVFLLLIFFMTTSSFVETERHLNSSIQVNRQSSGQQADFEPAIVEVVQSGGRFVYRLGERELTTQQELTAILRQFDNKADGAFVLVSDDAPFAMAAAAIQACKTARFAMVSYVPENAEN